ncbi:MAG: hypothetical protein Q9227_009134 [Pyrenula ochraceoflavens]
MDSKKHILKSEESSRKNSPLQTKATLPETQSQGQSQSEDIKPSTQASEPLAPPPKPAQQNTGEIPDYFSSAHGSGNHFALEPNPFDKSFGAPSDQTPGGSLLPPVAALTSPAIGGTSNGGGYTWPNSLRSGPLSPAMLAGPAGSGDYFTDNLSRGFPTPNESSLRTGLTPGGGGSMFPAPSPNSQALFQQLQSGGATPSTLDFHRTAMTAAARNKSGQFTSNPQDGQPATTSSMDQGAHGDAADAANGLFMLAKGGQANNNNNFAVPNQPPSNQVRQPDSSPTTKRSTRNAGSIGSYSGPDISGAGSDSHEDTKPATRGKGKKNTKVQAQTNGRRKAEDAAPRGGNKKLKGNGGEPNNVDPNLEPHMDDDDDDSDEQDEQHESSGKKMTDEEKRKNFLERNRQCRQRKKQWLANLQNKVEIFSSENDALTAQVQQLREEIVNLKTLLLAHKDCPVSQQQGIPGLIMSGMPGDPQMPSGYPNPHANPYGMAGMQNGHAQGMAQAGMQR